MFIEPVKPLSTTFRNWRHWGAILGVAMIVATFAGNACADEYLRQIGGPGGGEFLARCAGSEFLAGFELRAADDVDAIRPLCVTVKSSRETSAAS